ncbi:hypothetical protein PITC_089550 [Penicillium italicum]|uniref:Transmembrane protein n=1 Tax=Penicillium italicum TaxID=40296 RepID=A0A0A2L9Q2_PENIT|nr:hypothetical protein PITC_089550 [Penicillium italicum]
MPNHRVEVASINQPKTLEKNPPELEHSGDEEGKPFSVAPVVQFGQRRDSPSLVEFPLCHRFLSPAVISPYAKSLIRLLLFSLPPLLHLFLCCSLCMVLSIFI